MRGWRDLHLGNRKTETLHWNDLFSIINDKWSSQKIRQMEGIKDYRRPVRKSLPLHGRKIHSHSQFFGTAEAYFVCHIGPNFQIFLIYAFIGVRSPWKGYSPPWRSPNYTKKGMSGISLKAGKLEQGIIFECGLEKA